MERSELLMPSLLKPKCGITSFGRIESPLTISVELQKLKNVNFSRRTENFYRFSHHRQHFNGTLLYDNYRVSYQLEATSEAGNPKRIKKRQKRKKNNQYALPFSFLRLIAFSLSKKIHTLLLLSLIRSSQHFSRLPSC